MFRAALISVIAAFMFAAPAQAEVVTAEGGAGGGGHRLLWTMSYDDQANTLSVTATHTRLDGSAQAGFPQQAQIVTTLNNGQTFTLDLLTDGTVFDGGAPMMVNSGPRVRPNTRLRVSGNRSRLISFTTNYLPPA